LCTSSFFSGLAARVRAPDRARGRERVARGGEDGGAVGGTTGRRVRGAGARGSAQRRDDVCVDVVAGVVRSGGCRERLKRHAALGGRVCRLLCRHVGGVGERLGGGRDGVAVGDAGRHGAVVTARCRVARLGGVGAPGRARGRERVARVGECGGAVGRGGGVGGGAGARGSDSGMISFLTIIYYFITAIYWLLT